MYFLEIFSEHIKKGLDIDNIFEYLKSQKPELLIVSDEKEAIIARDVALFLGYEAFVLPDLRVNFGDDLLSFSDEIKQLSATLTNYYNYNKQNKLLISPIRTITFKLPKKECFKKKTISFGDDLDLEEFKNLLYNWGYIFVDVVEDEGEVSIRGDIVDIFIVDSDNPIRLSLFDTEIESIRYFNIEEQKSFDEIEKVDIIPAFLSLNSDILENIKQKLTQTDSVVDDFHSLGFWYLGDLSIFYTDILKSVKTFKANDEIDEVYIDDNKKLPKDKLLKLPLIPPANSYKIINIEDIKDFVELHKDKKITIISNNRAKIDELNLNIKYNFVQSFYKINLLSKDEVIISLNKEYKKRKKKKPKIILDELNIGDYVVHENYGIGKFSGIEPVKIMGGVRDFVVILYQNDDKLLLPVENIDLLDRYVANSGTIPILDKLGKSSFARIKEKIKKKLFEIANEIVKLAALRQIKDGIKIDINRFLIESFQKKAGFEYTKDQKKSIDEILEDLSSGKIMDRLLNGDVGFGKTEVAMNAIFAVFLNNKQSLFVAPTTLLANQHFHTLKNRFDEFRLKVAKIDGKTKLKEKKEILNSFKENKIHLLIGTHALLNLKDEVKNVALVIIDEEHKFGVKQKEKIKEFALNSHMLYMSATPIPRTLNLSLSKIKTISKLEIPPKERIGVRSFLKEYDEVVVKEAIFRELRRGGQIFYIFNNIALIENKKQELLKIIPNLKIKIMHSKIAQKKGEKILEEFENNEFNLLLSTSIVESGLNFINANTIIIDGANNFGIADLHQLRGRVGRGDKEGYCYFLVEDKNRLNKEAIKRLSALERNSYLGSGLALAYQDLEIRGGGNILGEAQSGNIKQIGYSLYIKMLEEAILSINGEGKNEDEKNIEIKLTVSAYLTSEFINNDRLRLDSYRKLAKAKNIDEVYNIVDLLEDRFGKIDEISQNYVKIIIIKLKALKKGIRLISNYNQNISFLFENGKKEVIKANSKDDEDILKAVNRFLSQ